MSSRDLVSVVIPVHGRFESADAAVRSACALEDVDVDIVVVDDASDPPYQPAAASGRDVRLVRLEENSGPGAAREAGRMRAKGRYLAYLDSDDQLDPPFARRLADLLEGAPELGMAYCAIRTEGSKRKDPWPTGAPILPHLLWGRPWHTSSCLWRGEAVRRIGPYPAVWRWEDYAYDNRAGCAGVRVGYLDEPLVCVADDSGVHISNTSMTPRRADGFARAVAVMVDDIAATSWGHDPAVRGRMIRLALSAAAQAADTRSADGAHTVLQSLEALRAPGTAARALIPAARIALRCGRYGAAARMLRRVRRGIPDPPAPERDAVT